MNLSKLNSNCNGLSVDVVGNVATVNDNEQAIISTLPRVCFTVRGLHDKEMIRKIMTMRHPTITTTTPFSFKFN